MIERDTRHRNADDSPYGFDEAARHPDRPVIIAYGREAALRLNRLRSRQFPFTTACLPQGGHFSAEELASWLADLKARDVLIWPMPGEEGGRRALAHANQIAGLGASAVGILKLASVTPFAAANITPMLELEFGKRLRPLILEALDEARALALPQQGDRPAQAVVATSEPADPAAFITSVEEFIARHVPLQKEQARNALSHWCLHAWCVRHPQNPFDLSPRLILQGVNHAGDHARALRVISWLVPSPRIVTCGTAHGLAALARLPRSTLLLDDVDGALLRRNDVTSFVATGARRDASFLSASSRRNMATQSSTCVPTAFAPTAIATEGDLPTRLILHAIVISVRSAKRGSAWSAPAFGAAPEEVRPLRAGMQALAESLVHSIDQTSEAPLPLSSVWQSRNWYPLMALATAIGERSGQAGQGIARLSVQSAFEPGLDLLSRLEALFKAAGEGHLTTAHIVESLNKASAADAGSGETELSARLLAEKLLRFGLKPVPVKLPDGTTARGYRIKDLQQAFTRHARDQESSQQESNGRPGGNAEVTEAICLGNGKNMAPDSQSNGVTDKIDIEGEILC